MLPMTPLLAMLSTSRPNIVVQPLSTHPTTGTVAELRILGPRSYANPFDPDEVAVDAKVTAPGDRTYAIPAFYYQPFSRQLAGRKEVDEPTGPGEWRVRILPETVGTYQIAVTVRDRSGIVSSKPVHISVSKSPKPPAVIRLSPKDERFFVRGEEPFYPIGANVAWGDDRKSFAYDDWLPKFAAQGANYARIWLGPSWSTFAIESPASGFARFDLGDAYRLDHVLDLARKHGMSLMLCVDSYNTLRDADAYPEWDTSPYNKANGGPLAAPADFWTNAEVRKRYKDKLRYLVARYSAYTNVFAWEFWNEVDLTRGFEPQTARQWHEEMAAVLRATDPYHHLVTTSFSSSPGFGAIDSLPGLDLIQTHLYSSNLVREAAVLHREKTGKAHMIGEAGADGGGPREEDKEGLQIHDALWVSLGCGMSGTAMTWWWDNLIAPNDLYRLYRPVASFVKGIDWPNEGFQAADVRLAYADATQASRHSDLEFVDGPSRFGEASYNRPSTVRIDGGNATGDLPVASILHGTKNHPELHNPITFEVNLAHSTMLEVLVGDVSGWGGAKLRVSLDGKAVLDRDFADTDSGTDSLVQYSGTYPVPIPAGRHKVTVENPGNDWMSIGYRFRGLAGTPKPPLDAYAVHGRSRAIVWLQVHGRSWRNVVELRKAPPSAPATKLSMAGLAKGSWDVEIWDTWSGTILGRTKTTSNGRTITPVPLPPIEKDLALRFIREK